MAKAKEAADKRSIRIYVRVTPPVKEELLKQAAAAQMDVSSYVNYLITKN